MSENKRTVERYMDAFGKADHAGVLACLTEDVEWVMPGFFSLKGKEAFDAEIENSAFCVHRCAFCADAVCGKVTYRSVYTEG